MAGFQLSPGVIVKEIDLTGIVPGVGTTEGGYAGDFQWGPLNKVIQVTNEGDLVDRFHKPDANTFTSFYTAANFLAYGTNLKVVRTGNTALMTNATADGSGYMISNEDSYIANDYDGSADVGLWAARYAGDLGNSLIVSTCLSATAYRATMAATANVEAGSTTITFSANAQLDGTRTLQVGDLVSVGGQSFVKITAFGAANTATLATAPSANATLSAVIAKWGYADDFESAPGTSTYTSNKSGSNDELHVVVVDGLGKFTGVAGTVLEKYGFVSKAIDAKNNDGTTNYYRDAILNRSQYIYWMDHHASGTNWGTEAANKTFTAVDKTVYSTLTGGIYALSTDAQRMVGYDYFKNGDEVDISLLMLGEASSALAIYVINNIAEYRKDCVVFLSPSKASAVDNAGSEQDDIITFRDLLPSSSYAFMDSGWKFQYDKYNGVFRWLPLNGDIAGLAVRTDQTRDPWFSIAGFNRGQIKNVVRLSWNPNKSNRDELYKKGINPVVTFPGEGTILYGDKTLLSKPSAFDRINVRRLFIVLEKAISRAAKYTLFEFNDRFTRAQFVNMTEPFLRDVKGRRGVYDFRVVCDETNNTPVVIDRNEFVGTIFIKPARSINFITLNFVAVGTGVVFEEVEGF